MALVAEKMEDCTANSGCLITHYHKRLFSYASNFLFNCNRTSGHPLLCGLFACHGRDLSGADGNRNDSGYCLLFRDVGMRDRLFFAAVYESALYVKDLCSGSGD